MHFRNPHSKDQNPVLNSSIIMTFNVHLNPLQKFRFISILTLITISLVNLELVKSSLLNEEEGSQSSSRSGAELKYVWGDALNNPEALGPNGLPYPWEKADQIAGRQRIPRSLFDEPAMELLTPEETRKMLLRAFASHHEEWGGGGVKESGLMRGRREGRASPNENSDVGEGCVPSRLCKTTYNTSAPMYGISLTSGQPVTIVQKFPDLLQQVVYQVCKSEECEVIQGQCVQTYLPYLFLVIPLGPVTLTGQDYVLVESGCACRPKYAKSNDDPPPLPFIQPFNSTKPRANKRF